MQKLERLRNRGIEPYPNSFHRSHTAGQAIELLKQQEEAGQAGTQSITVAGRVTAHRSMGKIDFLDLRDSSGKIQLYFNNKSMDEATIGLLRDIDIGDLIGVTGTLFRTKTNEPTVDVK